MSPEIRYSPEYSLAQLRDGDLDLWINAFEDYVKGWYLTRAQHLLACGSESDRLHGSYAALHLVIGFFETLESFSTGQDSRGNEGAFFQRGFMRVFGANADSTRARRLESIAQVMYKQVRCGLFHSLGTREKILLHYGAEGPVKAFLDSRTEEVGQVQINPQRFVDAVSTAFDEYLTAMRSPTHPMYADLRRAFDTTFRRELGSVVGP